MDKKSKDNKNIRCDAKNCIYHGSDCHCMASSISVGTHNACTCGDTVCETFEYKGDISCEGCNLNG